MANKHITGWTASVRRNGIGILWTVSAATREEAVKKFRSVSIVIWDPKHIKPTIMLPGHDTPADSEEYDWDSDVPV